MSSINTKVEASRLVTSPSVIANDIEISDEGKIRVVVENATGANTVVVKARIKGQTTYDTLSTIVGNANQVVTISTYDQIHIEVTTFGSAGGGIVRLSYSSFNEAVDSAIDTIGVDSGTNLSNVSQFNLTSSDNSIDITGDGIDTIDLKLAGGVGTSFGTIATPFGTNPVADTGNDTLTFISSDSNVVITGNAVSDQVDLAVSTVISTNLNKLDIFNLSALDISNKFVVLSAAPLTGSRTRVMVKGGIEQDILTDFIVVGTTLSWSGLGMDGLLETGDELVVTYN